MTCDNRILSNVDIADNKALKRKKGRKQEMNAIAKQISETPAANVQEMALRIKQEAPTLADLNKEQLNRLPALSLRSASPPSYPAPLTLPVSTGRKRKRHF
jgi:uncharacterized protein related to proFAR isomerase